jgi:hypothetical protein
MLIKVVGWDGEHAQPRLFEIPEQVLDALQEFVASGEADESMLDELNRLRSEDDSIADAPLSRLDKHYRERLAAMYVWQHLAHSELRPELTLEFPLR